MSLKQHSLQDLKNGYAEILGILEEYRSRTGAALRVGESRELVREFEVRALRALVAVAEKAVAVSERKLAGNPALTARDKEDFARDYGNKALRKIEPGHEGLPTIDQLLDAVVRIEAEMLSRGAQRFPQRIFSPKTTDGLPNGDGGGSGTVESAKTAPKYERFVSMLSKRGTDLSKLVLGIETLEKNQMRKIPYRVIWMPDPDRTVCISDEIGEKTYVYRGSVDMPLLAMHKKGDDIFAIRVIAVPYSKSYEADLERAIFGEDAPTTGDNPVFQGAESVADAETAGYRSELLRHA
jgi:hypothetical protein